MPSILPTLIFFFISSSSACIPTVTPEDMYEDEMTTTSTMATTSTSTTTTTTSTCSSATCMCQDPADLLFGNSCYRFDQTALYSFPNSKTRCGMLPGGTLCIITSPAENEFLADYWTMDYGAGGTFHIGGERTSDSDPYIWPDGVPFSSTWTNWAAGEPTTGANEFCTQVMVPSGEWISYDCSSTSYPCCEYPATISG